jgi:hypothetical protein
MADAKALYENLVANGYSKKDAAREAQKRTGVSLVSGAPIRSKQLNFTREGTTYGQQNTFYKGKSQFGQLYG